MKMIMAVIPKNTGESVLSALINAGYTATFSETRGGVLRQSQLSLFIAVKEGEVAEVLEIIKSNCKSRSHIYSSRGLERYVDMSAPATELGGAVTFVWKLDQFQIF